MTFTIRDEKGTVYNTVSQPAILLDIEAGTLIKIGEFADMKEQLGRYALLVTSVEDLVVMELPKDQTEIDKVFQNTGYAMSLYRQTMH